MYHAFLMDYKAKKRICVIIHNHGFDNPWLLNHVCIISNFYHLTWVVFTSKPNSNVIYSYRARGINVLVLKKSLPSLLALIKLFMRFRADIFCHGIRPTQISFLLAFIFNLRLIIFQHYSLKILNFSQGFWSRVTRIPNTKLLRIAIAYSDLVFVYSTEVFNEFINFGIDLEKLILTPLGIVSNLTIEQKKYTSSIKNFRIVVVGRLSVEKDLFLALDILRDLKYLGVQFSAHFFGTGPLEISLRNYIHVCKLEENVFFEGWKSDLGEIYDGSDLLLHTSKTEGYGQVIIESLIRGLKVFSTNVGVVQDLSDYEIGYLHIFQANQETAEIAKALAVFLSQDVFSSEKITEVLKRHTFSEMQYILECELYKLLKLDDT